VPVNCAAFPRELVENELFGVRRTPYATAAIAVPFLLFYGAMWVVFAYALAT
jgi:transcriptional regulator of aromatic amino acid metabolism